MSLPPGGVVTFLFSDIEGSTRLVKTLRERYPRVLAEHRRLVRAAIADRVAMRWIRRGDAFFVAFAGAKQAVLCALDIQRALAGHDWPAGAPSVTVIHRRDTLRASKIMQERAFANPKITFLWNSEVAKVLGQDKVTACGSAAPRTAPSRCCR